MVIDGRTYRIVGVLPDAVCFSSDQAKVWLPLEIYEAAGVTAVETVTQE